MTRPLLALSGGVTALLLSTAAWAAVTPEQVWQTWQDVSNSYGQTLTATSQERQGDTLVVTGITIASTFDGGSVKGQVDKANFRDLGNGTVEVTVSPEVPLAIETTDSAGAKTNVTATLRQPDLAMIASGTDSETRYDFKAPAVKVSVNEVQTDGAAIDMTLDVDLTTLDGNYIVTKAEQTRLSTSVTVGSAGLAMAIKDAKTASAFNLKGTVTELAGTSSGTLLDMAAMTDMVAALKAGFATESAFTYGSGTLDYDFAGKDADGKDQTSKGTGSIAGGSINAALNADRLSYGGGAKDFSVTLSGSGIPFPELKFGYAEAAFNFLLPVSKSDEPGDFAVLTRLVDFTISDEAWAMADPGKVLPRDPATIVIDTSGKLNWLIDIFDPKQAEAVKPGDLPAAIQSLDVREVKLTLAGAAVTGTGAFTFDNTDKTTFPGMPAPTGTLDLKIVGANGLLDKLIQLGLVPQDQAMGVRMMMGLFAKTVEGAADTLTSTLEFKDKGFYANGQRLQ